MPPLGVLLPPSTFGKHAALTIVVAAATGADAEVPPDIPNTSTNKKKEAEPLHDW